MAPASFKTKAGFFDNVSGREFVLMATTGVSLVSCGVLAFMNYKRNKGTDDTIRILKDDLNIANDNNFYQQQWFDNLIEY